MVGVGRLGWLRLEINKLLKNPYIIVIAYMKPPIKAAN